MSEGFVFGFEVPERWQPAGDRDDALGYTAESRPLGPDFDRACFAGPDHLIELPLDEALVELDSRIAHGTAAD